MSHKISVSNICDNCFANDYLTANQVAKMIGCESSNVHYMRVRKIYDKLPPCDAIRGDISPLWKRSTMDKFIESQPKISLKKVKIQIAKGRTITELARDLGVDRYVMYRFLNINNVTGPVARPIRSLVDDLPDQGYILAHRLLNKCIHNTLHI